MSKTIKAFTMPKWGIEMQEGVIREWHANVGDKINKGDLLLVIETDKIANDVELEYDGLMRHRVGDEGDTLAVGALLAVFANRDVSDDEIAAFVSNFKAADASFSGAKTDVAQPTSSPQIQAKIAVNTSISPMAKALVEQLSVDITNVVGTGRKGRITLQDVEQAAKAQGLFLSQDESSYEVIKLSSMRKTIAKRLTLANQTIPHFYLRAKINMDAFTAMRRENKQGTVNNYLIKASALALKEVPDVNVHFMGDVMHKFEHADISVAVSTSRGLITPIIRDAASKSVGEISSEMKELAQKAQDEKLKPSDYQGGTFSISNLGMMGIYSFDAIINPPMAAILAVGSTEKTVLPGGIEARIMHVTLCCDHRAIDGALGASWLQAFRHVLENPQKL
jgi:pyruvate dehydrogenase E2 component (dihydrolipoamide acetyltransferase)